MKITFFLCTLVVCVYGRIINKKINIETLQDSQIEELLNNDLKIQRFKNGVNLKKVDGGLSGWSLFSSCSAKCGRGTQTRRRSCTNPIPRRGGKKCVGVMIQSRPCFIKPKDCKIDGGLSGWSPFSSCSAKCGRGTQTRRRSCTNPVPIRGGKKCVGVMIQSRPCFIKPKDCKIITPAVDKTTQEQVITSAVGETTEEPVVVPAGETTQEPVNPPDVGKTTPEPVITPAVDKTTQEPVVTPVADETTTETVNPPAVDETTPEPVVTPVVDETTPETVVTPVVDETTPETVNPPAVDETTPEPVVTPAVDGTTPEPAKPLVVEVMFSKQAQEVLTDADRLIKEMEIYYETRLLAKTKKDKVSLKKSKKGYVKKSSNVIRRKSMPKKSEMKKIKNE